MTEQVSAKPMPKWGTKMIEFKSAFQLEQMIADLAGFEPKNVQVIKLGDHGDFSATFVGSAAGVPLARARTDVESACRKLRAKYKLMR